MLSVGTLGDEMLDKRWRVPATWSGERRGELLEYQMEFYLGSSELAERDPVRAYVFDDGGDAARTHHFIDILLRPMAA